MPATPMIYTRGILQEYNTNDETWSEFLNQQALALLDAARAQFTPIDLDAAAVAGAYTLTVQNFLVDQARAATLRFTGTGTFTVTGPPNAYWYIVINECTGIVNLKSTSGTSAPVRPGTSVIWTSDGTTAYVLDPTLDKVKPPAASVDMDSQKLINMAAATAATDGATLSNRLDQFVAPTNPLNLGTQRATNSADPIASTDLVTKAFMEAAIALLSLVNLPSVVGNSNKQLFVNAAGTNVEWRGGAGSSNAGAYFVGGW